MPKAVVGGVGIYGPEVIYGPGVSPLWTYFKSAPAQNSLLIKTDGTVTEQAFFANEDVLSDTTHTFILGGTRFTCEVGSFEYNALQAAGYTLTTIPDADTYSDDYQDVY